MNLEALLTFFGLLAAAVAIMGTRTAPVAPAVCSEMALAVFEPHGSDFSHHPRHSARSSSTFGWRLDMVTYLLGLGSFVFPVSGAVIAWLLWWKAKLSSRNLPQLEELLQSALREGEFDEVDRVLRKNRLGLANIPPNAATLLFNPRLVHQMINSHSFIHLELLARHPFMESLENRLQAVETVVRELTGR